MYTSIQSSRAAYLQSKELRRSQFLEVSVMSIYFAPSPPSRTVSTADSESPTTLCIPTPSNVSEAMRRVGRVVTAVSATQVDLHAQGGCWPPRWHFYQRVAVNQSTRSGCSEDEIVQASEFTERASENDSSLAENIIVSTIMLGTTQELRELYHAHQSLLMSDTINFGGNRMSALHIAIIVYRKDMVQELLQMDVDWNTCDELHRMTPLHWSHSLGRRGRHVMEAVLGGISRQCLRSHSACAGLSVK